MKKITSEQELSVEEIKLLGDATQSIYKSRRMIERMTNTKLTIIEV